MFTEHTYIHLEATSVTIEVGPNPKEFPSSMQSYTAKLKTYSTLVYFNLKTKTEIGTIEILSAKIGAAFYV